MPVPEEVRARDRDFFNGLLDRFEHIWEHCLKNKSISKSAAFQSFVVVDQTAQLIHFFDADEEESIDEGDSWKTKQ